MTSNQLSSEVLVIIKRSEFNKICSQIKDAVLSLLQISISFQVHEDAVLIYWKNIDWVEFEERGENLETIAFSDKLFEIGAPNYYLINIVGNDSRYNLYRGTYKENPFQAAVSRTILIANPACNYDSKKYINNL